LSVTGNKWPQPEKSVPWEVTRPETERFLYYDGLVPAPNYIHCERLDDNSVTLHNRADFDIGSMFVIDHREKGRLRYAFLGPDRPLSPGASLKVTLNPVAAREWPALGVKQLEQVLLDRGLFQPETRALVKIWQKGLLGAEGVTVFHLLPQNEYDRMLELKISPAPVNRPLRVGIVRYPHVEIEPVLAQRVAQLISQLDDERFENREQATRTLAGAGPPAIAMIRAELTKNLSVEKKHRLAEVLERIDASEWLNSVPGKP
jgi:hypothetical protein